MLKSKRKQYKTIAIKYKLLEDAYKQFLINYKSVLNTEHPYFNIIVTEEDKNDIKTNSDKIKELLNNPLYKTLANGSPEEQLKEFKSPNKIYYLAATSWRIRNDEKTIELYDHEQPKKKKEQAVKDVKKYNSYGKEVKPRTMSVVFESGVPMKIKLPKNQSSGTVDTLFCLSEYDEDKEKELKEISELFNNENNLNDVEKRLDYNLFLVNETSDMINRLKELLNDEENENYREEEKINKYESLI